MSGDIQIFQTLYSNIDGIMQGFIADSVSNIIGYATPIVGLCLTLQLMVAGLFSMYDHQREPLSDLGLRTIKWVMVLGFASAGGLYQSEIMHLILSAPNEISNVLSGSQDNATFGQTVDHSITVGLTTAQDSANNGGFIEGAIDGVVIVIGTVIFAAIAGALGLMAQVMLAVCVVFGPVFILCLLFDTTKNMFPSWAGSVITNVLIIGLVSAIFSMLTFYFTSLVNNAPPDASSLQKMATVLCFTIVAIFSLLAVPKLAASWANGVAAGFGATPQLAGKATSKTVETAKNTSKSAANGVQGAIKKGVKMAADAKTGGAASVSSSLARKGS